MTDFRYVRKFHPDQITPEDREKMKPKEYPCPVCGKVMLIAPGQIQGCHKECRKKFKEILTKQRKGNKKMDLGIEYETDIIIGDSEKENENIHQSNTGDTDERDFFDRGTGNEAR